ncbi:MAG TPA: Pvc16 family protein [Thermomicrobiales bacterium]|nr:Pvc16 family protein [Thermomicrobiales bacterium]
MSNTLAIAAVSATLRNLLAQACNADPDLAGTGVTMRPPDKARDANGDGNQLNLFLYQTAIDAAWRNRSLPGQAAPGEVGPAPLPLTLYYLLTAYGQNNDDVFSHLLLGRAMRVLHDHPVLGADEIAASLNGNNLQEQVDLQRQVERVRITPQPLTLDELSKLWTTFQTQYRLSAAYQVSVVLIESARPLKAPLPVLARGRGDPGPAVRPDPTPFPALTAAGLPPDQGKRPSALPGDILVFEGHHLDGDDLTVSFANPRLPAPIPVPLGANTTADGFRLTLPDAPDAWVAGLYRVHAAVTAGGETRTTNEIPLALAPAITTPRPITAAREGAGDATLTLTCAPQVRPEQPAVLLLGDREIAAEPHAAPTDRLTFVVRAAVPGTYPARLRVDGVDSILIDYTASPPTFRQTEQVTIT